MLSIWYWALQRTAQYFSEIYTLIHSYSIHIFVLVRRYKNVENSRMNHNDLKIVWNVTYGPFIAASLRSCFIMENLLLISPSLSLVSHPQKVGRPLLTVWMQTTEICIWTEEDYPLLLCTIFPFFFFFAPAPVTDCCIFSWLEPCHIPDCCATLLLYFFMHTVNSISHSKLFHDCSNFILH